MIRVIVFTLYFLSTVQAIKFCANKYLPSGSCPANALEICANSGNYCTKSDPVELQYSVTGVSGCEQFQSGGHSGEACHGMHVGDDPDGSPSCYPMNRNYCECVQCTTNSDCDFTFHGLPTGCTGNEAGSGDIYAAGFAAGKECGIENCADAVREAYRILGKCSN